MINLTTSGNSIIFEFQDNPHYLQNGTIEVPKNSLLLVTDDSNMASFKKSASNDIFISALYSELGMTKAELEAWFEENATTDYGGGGGGGGITSGQVETMIDDALTDYYDIDEVDAAITAATDDMATQTWVGSQGYITGVDLSNYDTKSEVNTKISTATGLVNNTLTAHTADTNVHVTSSEKSTWNAKSDFSGSYNDLTDKPTIPTVPTSNSAFTNDAGYITEDAISGKADTSAVTAVNNVLTAHTADTTIHVTSSDKSTWSGKQDALVSGTNIKTINNESLLGSGNIDIQGGGAVSSAITSGDTNAVAGGAVYDKFDEVEQVTAAALNTLNDNFGGLKLVKLTQAEYDALTTKDSNTLYIIASAPFAGKWFATYTGGTTDSASCDSTSAITGNEITLTDLENLVIGDCVGSIDMWAFDGANSLTSVTISDSVTSIANYAFQNCDGLTDVTIGSGVTSIGEGAFNNTNGSFTLTIHATTPPTLTNDIFSEPNGGIFVPAEAVQDYQNANIWSNYAQEIQPIQ